MGGKQGHLVFLDCRDNGYEHVPLDKSVSFVLANTKAPHQLVDGKYAELNRSCMNAAKYFKDHVDDKVTHLRDVTVEMWEVSKETLSTSDRTRSKHIVFENKRVFACVEALRGNDAEMLGKLMRESHQSSSEDFGNSCPELDAMVKAAEGLPGWYGGRLMGGGFGGCTINLVWSFPSVMRPRQGSTQTFSLLQQLTVPSPQWCDVRHPARIVQSFHCYLP